MSSANQKRWFVLPLFLLALAFPATASADFLQVYGNAHGSYLGGDAKQLSYFENNDAGPGFGFTLGAEIVQIDAFLDANFHPTGSQWNQLGIGFDMDVIPGDFFVEPGAQVVYFFGKQEGDIEGVKGLFPRVGVQAGMQFAKILYAGVDGWFGYVLALPDTETGVAYIGSLYVGVRFGVL